MLQFDHAWRVPGQTEALENTEGQIWWGGFVHQPLVVPVFLDGSARDTGNGKPTILRPGLLLGRVTATGMWRQWNPTATDGSEHIAGVLLYEVQTQAAGADANRWFGYAMVAGCLKESAIIVPGSVNAGLAGNALEFEVRNQLTQNGRFVLDTNFQGGMGGWLRVVPKTANYTLDATDHGTLFTNEGATGAVTFTLPMPRRGYRVGFYIVANQNITISANPSDTLVVDNDAAADTVSMAAASNKIGAFFEVVQTASLSLIFPRLWPGQTVAITS
jgi:hypothetical protein